MDEIVELLNSLRRKLASSRRGVMVLAKSFSATWLFEIAEPAIYWTFVDRVRLGRRAW
jgi:hypothetical protein